MIVSWPYGKLEDVNFSSGDQRCDFYSVVFSYTIVCGVVEYCHIFKEKKLLGHNLI